MVFFVPWVLFLPGMVFFVRGGFFGSRKGVFCSRDVFCSLQLGPWPLCDKKVVWCLTNQTKTPTSRYITSASQTIRGRRCLYHLILTNEFGKESAMLLQADFQNHCQERSLPTHPRNRHMSQPGYWSDICRANRMGGDAHMF